MAEKPKSLSEIDAFWELDELMPQKHRGGARREVNTDTVELELPSREGSRADEQARFGGTKIPPREATEASMSASSEGVHRSARDEAG